MKLIACMLLMLLFAISLTASAQFEGGRPITLVVPYSPGGTTDILARALADGMSRSLGQQVIVENKAGAGGQIGSQYASVAAPDGRTLLVASNNIFVSDPELQGVKVVLPSDFFPIGRIAVEPLVLVGRANLVERSSIQSGFKDIYTDGRKRLTIGSYGLPIERLVRESLARAMRLDLDVVPYKGSGPTVNDLLGGQSDAAILPISMVAEHVRRGMLYPIMTFTTRRSKVLGNVPTASELGVQGCNFYVTYSLFAPAKTSKELAGKLKQGMKTGPDLERRIAQMGMLQPRDLASLPDHCASCIETCEKCSTKDTRDCCPE